MQHLYVGLMSGTSTDGVDAALVDFSKIQPNVIGFNTTPYPEALRQTINELCQPGGNEIVKAGRADRDIARVFADATLGLLKQYNVAPKDVVAIGSHGQTVRHHPDSQAGFTLQLGDPNTISVLTGIDVVADFRRKDLALGGQGAPLAPAFHNAVFADHHQSRAVLNIGGISNLTYLPCDRSRDVIGFDTGPGNTLMDAWCLRHTGKFYDKGGAWAASGTSHPRLLKALLADPYFAKLPPKSTGRERFNLAWLDSIIDSVGDNVSPPSVQATLAELTAFSIAEQINRLGDVSELYVCGGGAQNDFLMECMENELFDCTLYTTQELGIHPDAVEAVAFAWLAYAHVQRQPGNLPSVTGASRATVLGSFFPSE